ncbi:MAG TPA: hypothetical protein VEL75_22880, partial [Candidatus Methylomirabilis sp.]|nr:hypothetical protein [Candidatus Methylomirabilis sp.]
ACILLALYGFIDAYLGGGRWALVVFYGGLGLAALAKDFLGALGPLAIVALFLWLTREAGTWRQWVPARGAVLLLALGVPWYLLVEAHHRGFLWYTVVDNHLLNVTRQRVFPDEDVPLSALEFLGVTAVGFFPWVLALPLGLWRALSRPWSTATARCWMLLALWAIGIVGVFTASLFKLPHYGLPALPAMALLSASAWDEAIERTPGAPRSWRLLLPALLATLALGAVCLATWRGWLGLSSGAIAVADVSARNMAAQGQTATTDFLGQFRPLLGHMGGIFALVALALAAATWRRLPLLGVGALLAGMIAFLPVSAEGLTLFARSRSVRVMTDAITLRAGPGDVIANEGPIENSASALIRLDRPVQIVNGLQSNLAFGATFPEARSVFWTAGDLAGAWAGDRRVFLLTSVAPTRSVVGDLPAGAVHLLVEGGGRRLYSNRP